MFCLVDANNFYCSVEVAFRPSLKGKPLVVLSNNDGCVIARSNEAKDLGVKMGQPWFECKSLVRRHGLQALSANFALYGDMSNRLMTIASRFAPRMEAYSIECFLDLSGVGGCLTTRCRALREQLLQWLGLPCCAGLGPTKTLAKLANHVAKSAERKPGSFPQQYAQVCNLEELAAHELRDIFRILPVSEVWGVGPRTAAKLKTAGVHTVDDFLQRDASWVRQHFSVVLERTLLELQGVPCFELEEGRAQRDQIMVSRSFGAPLSREGDIAEAVVSFTSRAAEKLRGQGSLAGTVLVSIQNSPFKQPDLHYSASTAVHLPEPSADSSRLAHAALTGLRRIFRPGLLYTKAGVLLVDLCAHNQVQPQLELLAGKGESRDKDELMAVLDAVNSRFGRGTLVLAGSGHQHSAWAMQQRNRSPRYTCLWDELPVAKA